MSYKSTFKKLFELAQPTILNEGHKKLIFIIEKSFKKKRSDTC